MPRPALPPAPRLAAPSSSRALPPRRARRSPSPRRLSIRRRSDPCPWYVSPGGAAATLRRLRFFPSLRQRFHERVNGVPVRRLDGHAFRAGLDARNVFLQVAVLLELNEIFRSRAQD